MNGYQLILMRHAKSDWSYDLSDFERPISAHGKASLNTMAAWIKTQKWHPKKILCSPAKRAKETIDYISDSLSIHKKTITWCPDLYGANLQTLLDVISEHAENTSPCLLVGHNPGLEMLLCYLSKDAPEHNVSGKILTTANIAVLQFKTDHFNTKKNSAQLINLKRPRELPRQ